MGKIINFFTGGWIGYAAALALLSGALWSINIGLKHHYTDALKAKYEAQNKLSDAANADVVKQYEVAVTTLKGATNTYKQAFETLKAKADTKQAASAQALRQARLSASEAANKLAIEQSKIIAKPVHIDPANLLEAEAELGECRAAAEALGVGK